MARFEASRALAKWWRSQPEPNAGWNWARKCDDAARRLMKPPTATEHWRRLSIDLKHERNPFICQIVRRRGPNRHRRRGRLPEPEEAGFIRWQEHDQQDRPQPIYLVLCKECSDRLIEPHERLYRPLDKWAPALGAMRFCLHCANFATGCIVRIRTAKRMAVLG
jgi:hypothetical protein